MKQYKILLIIAILSLVSGFIYLKLNYSSAKQTSVYEAIPANSPFFAEIQPGGLTSIENKPLRNILETSFGEAGLLCFRNVDSVFNVNPEIVRNLQNEVFLVAFNVEDSKQITPVILHKSVGRKQKKSIESLIKHIFPKESFTFGKTKSNITETVVVTSKTSGNKFYYCFLNGLFVACPGQLILNQTISQIELNKDKKPNSSELVKKPLVSNEQVSVYINYKSFTKVIGNLINPQSFIQIYENGDTLTHSFKSLFEGFENFAGFSNFDLLPDGNFISLSGLTTVPDSTNQFLGIFKGQTPQRFQADEVTPANALFNMSFSFSDKKLFFEQLDKYWQKNRNNRERDDYFEKIEAQTGHNLKSDLEKSIDNEIITTSFQLSDEASEIADFLIFHLSSKENALKNLQLLLNDYTVKERIGTIPNFSEIKIDDSIKDTVYKFPFSSLPEKWLGMPFSPVNASYVAFWKNYMVFSNSLPGMEVYLKKLHGKMVLANSERYKAIKSKKMVDLANISFYLNLEKSMRFNDKIFAPEMVGKINRKKKDFSQFKEITWQIMNDNVHYYNVITLNSDTLLKDSIRNSFPEETMVNDSVETIPNPLLIWKVNSGNQITLIPQMVINHNDPANLEIIYQDKKNNLVLTTNEGKALWRKPVSGPILNKIHQVDILKNGKLQYLFNTEDKLYLVDRNGKDISPFPIILPSVATAGISVFDYEKDKNYRIFIPCADKKVYVFDKAGKKVSGWLFGQTKSDVNSPVQYIRIGSNDYIFFKDKSKLYILDRKGQSRVKTLSDQDFSDNPVFYLSKSNHKIVITDKTGTIWFYGLNGKTEKKILGKFSNKHFFICEDLDMDDRPEFVFLDNKKLTVFSYSGNPILEKEFKTNTSIKPQIIKSAKNKKEICITDEKAKQIFLYNSKGELRDGFPVSGNTGSAVGILSKKSNVMSLIAGGEDGVLYNYKLTL